MLEAGQISTLCILEDSLNDADYKKQKAEIWFAAPTVWSLVTGPYLWESIDFNHVKGFDSSRGRDSRPLRCTRLSSPCAFYPWE